jgi:kynureninase
VSRSGGGEQLAERPGLEAWAREQDAADPLAWCLEEFERPVGEAGAPLVYLCGNSLGLMPRGVRSLLAGELEAWSRQGVEAHLEGPRPWYSYHEPLLAPMARLVGADPGEIALMNSLTVNLHLMLVSLYRPAPSRWRVLLEDGAFPSDAYAIESHLRARGLDPADGMIRVRPRTGETLLRTEDVESLLTERGKEIALVLLPGVQYYTGQCLDIERITRAAHQAGSVAGFDLAHAAGNVPLRLHDWNVDFAVWCSYKYLNAGPGAVAGCFLHQRHAGDRSLPRFAGWWGNDPATRFEMDRPEGFVPVPDAGGWQLSNPPVLAMAPLIASLELFERAGLGPLRAKSERLTGYLEALLRDLPAKRIRLLSPAEPARRGCQLSYRVGPGALGLADALRRRGIVVDYRAPDVIRLSPVPLYNTYHDVWAAAEALRELVLAE